MPPCQGDTDALNAAVDRMRKHIPEQPYIQSIPQDEPWRHRSGEHANAWRKDVPFKCEEQSDLQYQTFYYHEHGTNLIHLGVHSPPHQHGAMSNADAPKSLTSTPKVGPKKKISLADYKNQKVDTPRSSADNKKELSNGTHKAEREDARRTGSERSTKISNSSTRDFGAIGENEPKRKRSPEPSVPDDSPAAIRRRTEKTDASNNKPSHLDRKNDAATPVHDRTRKRDRESGKKDSFELPPPMSPLPPPVPDCLSPVGVVLPECLSPTLPANVLAELDLSPGGVVLPECLSPTLPANVLAELDRREERKRARSDASKSSSGLSAKANPEHDSVRSVVKDVNHQYKKRKETSNTQERPSKVIKTEESGVEQKQTSKPPNDAIRTKEAAQEQRPRFMHVFKIPKGRRQDAARLLKFPPRPCIRPVPNNDAQSRKPAPARISSSASKEVSKQGHRRTEATPRSPSPSRKTARAQEEKIALQPPFQSPPLPNKDPRYATPSAQKPSSNAMARIPSTDSHQNPSPSAPTPSSATSHPKPSPSSHPPGSDRSTPLSQAWQAESDRLITMGRTLKQSAQKTQHSKHRWEQEHATLAATEALCCFMLAFHAQDRAAQHMRAPAAPYARAPRTWGTMNALWSWTWAIGAKWTPLRHLIASVGVVYAGRIYAWEERERRVEKEGGAGDRTDEIRAKMLEEVGRNMGLVAQGKGVGIREVRERWPRVWARVMDGSGRKGEERGVGEYEGEVVWPLTLQTGVVEGVRTVVEMLSEWRAERRWEATLRLTRG